MSFTTLLTIITHKTKCLEISLTKEIKDMYKENDKMVLEETKEDTRK